LARAEGGRTTLRLATRSQLSAEVEVVPGTHVLDGLGLGRGAGASGAPAGGPAAACSAEGSPSAGSSRKSGRTRRGTWVSHPGPLWRVGRCGGSAGRTVRVGRRSRGARGSGWAGAPGRQWRGVAGSEGARWRTSWAALFVSARRRAVQAPPPPRPSVAGPGPHRGDGAASVVPAGWTSLGEAAAALHAVAGEPPPGPP